MQVGTSLECAASQSRNGIRHVYLLQICVRKRIIPNLLNSREIDTAHLRIRECRPTDIAHLFGNGIRLAQARGVGDQRTTGGIEQHTLSRLKALVPRLYRIGDHIGRSLKDRAIHLSQGGGEFHALQPCAVAEGFRLYALQPAVATKCNVRQAHVIVERLFANACHRSGNFNMPQIVAARKSRLTDFPELSRKDDLAQTGLSLKGAVSDTAYRLSLNGIGDLYVGTTSCVRADLNGPIIQLHVGKGNTVLLVYPMGVQRQVCGKFVCIPVVFFGEVGIIVPAVKNGVQALRLGNILQGMITNEYLLGIFQLIRHHIEGDRTPRLLQKRVRVDHTVSKIPIAAKLTQVVAGCK